MAKQQTISCDDGHPIALSLFEAKQPRGVVIIGGALGIPQQYYTRTAFFFAEHHYHCICFSYRGTEESRAVDKAYDIGIDDWGRRDIDAVIQFAQGLATSLPIHFIGHSIGGQLFALAQSSTQLQSAVLVAASCPYWRRWHFPQNLKMLFVSRLLIPLVSALNTEFPSRRLGLGNASTPSAVARRWAQWMSKPDYLFDSEFAIDTSNFSALTLPILSLDFTDDALAPAINVQKLLHQFPKADIDQRSVDPKDLDLAVIGHSGFFNKKCRDSLWQETLSWISAKEAAVAEHREG